jgi:antitoxin component YwqK of YwqJK toxin-antitoxin module
MAEGYFKNGKEDGVFTAWDIDGKFKNKILCKDGMQQ